MDEKKKMDLMQELAAAEYLEVIECEAIEIGITEASGGVFTLICC